MATDDAPSRLCFVIGPMRDIARLERLASIVRSLVEPTGFYVETPDSSQIGSIMRQVLGALDQADLLVADLTGNNPNVLYELGVYHCMGKPYVMVQEEGHAPEGDPPPFDIAAYRYHTIDLSDTDTARKAASDLLAAVIRDALAPERQQAWHSNPVTDFYQAPLTQIPSAGGLVHNYMKNFVARVVPDVFRTVGDIPGGQPILEVCVASSLEQREPDTVVTGPARANLRLELLVPREINESSHEYVNRLRREGRIVSAVIKQGSRPFTLYARPNGSDGCCLVDVPTVLSTLNESLEQRLQRQRMFDDDDERWNRLERAELDRFWSALVEQVRRFQREQHIEPGQLAVIEAL